ncbi:MAG: hypothetical protein KJ749_01385 [Planctomycetes bacterium]|nr:hypothetical protein [Planctomycetota bacterium]
MFQATCILGAASNDVELTAAGAAIMAGSVLLVVGLLTFCMRRILTEKHPEKHHAPLDIDTHDLDP